MIKEHYKTLGVSQDASPLEIKKAYQKLAKKYHSDREGGSDEMMSQINIAYGVLRDPEQRAAYDAAPSEIESAAQNLFTRRFVAHLKNLPPGVDPVSMAVRKLHEELRGIIDDDAKAQQAIVELERHMTKIKRKTKGHNFVSESLKEIQLEAMNQHKLFQKNIEIFEYAISLANEFEYEYDHRTQMNTPMLLYPRWNF